MERERGRKLRAELVRALAASCSRIGRSITLSSSSREAEARCSTLRRPLSTVISFADGFGVLEPEPSLARDAFTLSETTRGSGLAAARSTRLARSSERYGELQEEVQAASEELARLARAGVHGAARGRSGR